jgi:hypothetical protein
VPVSASPSLIVAKHHKSMQLPQHVPNPQELTSSLRPSAATLWLSVQCQAGWPPPLVTTPTPFTASGSERRRRLPHPQRKTPSRSSQQTKATAPIALPCAEISRDFTQFHPFPEPPILGAHPLETPKRHSRPASTSLDDVSDETTEPLLSQTAGEIHNQLRGQPTNQEKERETDQPPNPPKCPNPTSASAKTTPV